MKNPLKGKSRTVQVLIVIGFLLLLIGIVYALTTYVSVHNTGSIQSTVGLSASLSTIDWGDQISSSPISKTFTVTNTGNTPLTVSVASSNLPSYLALTATLDKSQLNLGQTATCTLILSANSNAVGGTVFSFDVVVTGTS